MDIYDILQRLVEARPFQPHEQQESLGVIADLRALNVFGSLARQIREDHECNLVPLNPYGGQWPKRCLMCMREVRSPEDV